GTNGSAGTSGGKENADATGRVLADGKDAFAKDGQQSKYSTTESPCRFDQQQREHASPVFDVFDSLDRFSYSQKPAQREFLSDTLFALREANTRNQNSREHVAGRVENESDVSAKQTRDERAHCCAERQHCRPRHS